MFVVNLRRVYCACDKLLIRSLRTRRFDGKPGPNPGLDERINAFQEQGFEIVDNDAEEFIEQSASDFSKAGIAYGEHIKEKVKGKHKLSHHIVRDKYFKEYLPNLLTWSEKEQIRHLHTTEPNEWTVERISESFPVTEAVVKKLLKFPWKPTTEQRIARHDASAMRNWRELKEGTLDIPEELRQKFLKFSDRTIPPLNKKLIKIDVTQEKMGEYEKIIQRCANENAKKYGMEEDSTSNSLTSVEVKKSYKNKFNVDKKRVTFEELTAKIKVQLETGKNVDLPDQIIMDSVKSSAFPTETVSRELSNDIELHSNSQRNELAEYKDKEKNLNIMDYPERIRISKKAYKKGATYKVNDCYYDDDGKFLYRVLGMTN